MYTKRNSCVLCSSISLRSFYTLEKFPLLSNPTDELVDNDVLFDYEYMICDTCKCVQLVTLIDPSILYSSDNKSSLTPLWREHHFSFADFIKRNTKDHSFCEIGGGSNNLYSYFENIGHYTVLDLYDPLNPKENIQYLKGNCESFTDYIDTTLILSHTFEHLYNPKKFIEAIQKSIVKDVFISVPNMKCWLETNSNSFLINNQHTFYFEKEDIVALFSQFGFNIANSFDFQNHSLFYHFQKSSTTVSQPIPVKTSWEKIFRHFNEKSHNASLIKTNKDIYIMPSFYLGQIAFFYLQKHLTIKGFLDNDKNKIGKRLYGTPYYTFSPNILKHLSPDTTAVVLCNTPYLNEMKAQLLQIAPNIEIFNLVI